MASGALGKVLGKLWNGVTRRPRRSQGDHTHLVSWGCDSHSVPKPLSQFQARPRPHPTTHRGRATLARQNARGARGPYGEAREGEDMGASWQRERRVAAGRWTGGGPSRADPGVRRVSGAPELQVSDLRSPCSESNRARLRDVRTRFAGLTELRVANVPAAGQPYRQIQGISLPKPLHWCRALL